MKYSIATTLLVTAVTRSSATATKDAAYGRRLRGDDFRRDLQLESMSLSAIEVTGSGSKSKSAKSMKPPSNAELAQQIKELEKEVKALAEASSSSPSGFHPTDATCEEDQERIDQLITEMPEGCLMEPFPLGSEDSYRVFCDKPGSYNVHLPDMCNAKAILVAGGGAGGSAPSNSVTPLASGGGGAGGVVNYQSETTETFSDGYYLVEVGEGGTQGPLARFANGGDTTLKQVQKLSAADAEFGLGRELRALGGGRGGGVLLTSTFDDSDNCQFPSPGGSGGGGPGVFLGKFCSYGTLGRGAVAVGSDQGFKGGDTIPITAADEKQFNLCGSGGGGAGSVGDGSSYTEAGGHRACVNDQGGEGIYFGDIVGDNYGDGGWFASGGNSGDSSVVSNPGGGGYRGELTKNGMPGTGGGGMGCRGSENTGGLDQPNENVGIANTTCIIEQINPEVPALGYKGWGPSGGSGAFFIVFDKCPCGDDLAIE